MADEPTELSAETAALAALGRGEEAPAAATEENNNNTAATAGADEIPEWVPEKFRKDGKPDYEAMAKAYGELEKKLGQPKGDADADASDDGDGADADGEGDDVADDGDADAGAGISAELFSAAEAEWAEKGELSAETREKIIAGGVPAATLDTYLAGVAALSAALTASVYETAGGEDDYKAAVEWARENWSEKQIEKFDDALNDADLMPPMVRGLMADYRAANPGEGSQTRGGGGSDAGDVYHDAEEFTRDLQDAQLKNDPLLRKKAVQKLERSKKAGTLKHVTPRSGTQALLG